MAESKILNRGFIYLNDSKTVSIGTTATEVSFTYSVPDNYTVVSAMVYHGYPSDIVGGLEGTSRSRTYGYYKRTSGAITTTFTIKAIAVPNEMLNQISVS